MPHAPVLDYRQLFALEQAAARGLKVTVRDAHGQPVELVGSPFHIAGTTLPATTLPPQLGEHTDAVLRDVLGCSSEEVARLRRDGVV